MQAALGIKLASDTLNQGKTGLDGAPKSVFAPRCKNGLAAARGIGKDPDLKPLRGEPRFAELVAHAGEMAARPAQK